MVEVLVDMSDMRVEVLVDMSDVIVEVLLIVEVVVKATEEVAVVAVVDLIAVVLGVDADFVLGFLEVTLVVVAEVVDDVVARKQS